MALPISVTYTFATATTAIPLSQLDTNFTTVVNGINGIGNGTNTLSNVVISGGTITGLSAAIPVASGGTGLTSPGASGNVLTSNGTNWTSSISSFSAVPTIVAFTSSGTFTVPAGVTKVKVTVVGGGGGGGSGTSYSGGGGGGTAIKTITGLTPGGTVAVTVGAGGVAAAAGVTSSFGAYCSATGGGFAVSTTPGSGGIGSNGDLNIGGQAGTVDSYNGYGTGGSSFLGGGGGYGAGNVGRQYGGGAATGSNGASGVVVVEY